MSESTLPSAEGTPLAPLPWPPPGLGRIQGDLWIVARKMAIVAAVLVVPLLTILTFPQSPYGLGPLGEAWWITLLTTVLGVALFTETTVSLVRFLTRVRTALREGYAPHVLALVVVDRDRDNGFLLQGLKEFSPLSEAERKTMGRLRFLTALAYLVAATWVVVGFGLLLLVAAHGGASVTGVGLGTLGPAALIGFAGLVLRGTEGTLAYRAREAWHNNEWSEDLARHEIDLWQNQTVERGFESPGAIRSGSRTWPTVALVGAVVGAFIAILPAMTLVPASSAGAVFSELGGWSYTRSLERAAAAEAFRAYRIDPDPGVTPAEAGEILQVIARSGQGPHPSDRIRVPTRSYEEEWLPDSPPEGFRPEAAPFWTDTVWSWVDRGLSAEEGRFLRRAAEHPARAEFSRLASAGSIDVIAGLYALPFDDEATFFELPMTSWGDVRLAAYTHLGLAALQASEGRHADAERTVREVISVGFLLNDDAPVVMANYLGAVLVRNGGDALVEAVELSGDPARADAIDRAARVAQAAAERMAVGQYDRPSGDDYLRTLPDLAEDPNALRGLRWEMAHLVTVFTPCANLRRVVFGPDQEYFEWINRVRSSLVRYESEEAYFEVAMRGIAPMVEPGLLSRFLAVSMGGIHEQGSCAQVLAVLPAL